MALVLITFLIFPLGPSRADLEFQHAAEEFVIASAPGHEIPQPYRTMVQNLGCEFWLNRENAARLLESRIRPHVRWLFWARKSRDLEIAMRANVVLKRIYRCPDCQGVGSCLVFRLRNSATQRDYCERCSASSWHHGNASEAAACLACGGTGSAWNKGIFE